MRKVASHGARYREGMAVEARGGDGPYPHRDRPTLLQPTHVSSPCSLPFLQQEERGWVGWGQLWVCGGGGGGGVCVWWWSGGASAFPLPGAQLHRPEQLPVVSSPSCSKPMVLSICFCAMARACLFAGFVMPSLDAINNTSRQNTRGAAGGKNAANATTCTFPTLHR